jgi:hypothetical protein
MSRRPVVFTSLLSLGLLAAGLYSTNALSRCDPDSIGSGNHVAAKASDHVKLDSSAPTQSRATPNKTESAQVRSADEATQRVEKHSVTSEDNTRSVSVNTQQGGASSSPSDAQGGDDASGNLGDGGGSAPGVHKRTLRWQSFLPGVIK